MAATSMRVRNSAIFFVNGIFFRMVVRGQLCCNYYKKANPVDYAGNIVLARRAKQCVSKYRFPIIIEVGILL